MMRSLSTDVKRANSSCACPLASIITYHSSTATCPLYDMQSEVQTHRPASAGAPYPRTCTLCQRTAEQKWPAKRQKHVKEVVGITLAGNAFRPLNPSIFTQCSSPGEIRISPQMCNRPPSLSCTTTAACRCISHVTSFADPLNVAASALYVIIIATAAFAFARRDITVLWGLALTVVPFIPASNTLFPIGAVVAERVSSE